MYPLFPVPVFPIFCLLPRATTVRLSLTDHDSAIAHRPQGYAPTSFLLPTAYCLLPTAYCLLPLLPTAYCLLPSSPAAFFPHSTIATNKVIVVNRLLISPKHRRLLRY